jgi:hypothetical protein
MFLRSRFRPVRRADNLTAICQQTVYTMWDPRDLTTLQASTACYGDSFIYFYFAFIDETRIRKH